MRIIGRVFNTSNEDTKLKEDCVGLMNTSENMTGDDYKIKLNLSEVKAFSFFEGEIIVAEGFKVSFDKENKFNVTNVYKLAALAPNPSFSPESL